MLDNEKRQDDVTDIELPETEIELPESIIQAFARFLVPEIRKFYESEEGQREFEEWQNNNLGSS